MAPWNLGPVPAFSDNYIWRLTAPNGGVWLVDPGDASAVAGEVDIAGVLITHHHPDHIGGLPDLLARRSIPVYAPHDPRIPVATHRVVDGDVVDCGGLVFEVMATPGHTLSHVCYVAPGLLFCGDTLFSLGCGRLFEGTPAQMLASLDRLRALPGQTLVCCAHEYTAANARFALSVDPDNAALHEHQRWIAEQHAAGQPTLPSTIAFECRLNPFLRTDESALQPAIHALLGRAAHDRVEAFAALRRAKDQFRG